MTGDHRDERSGRIHVTAQSFDGAADVYEQARPGYPDEVVAAIVAELDLGPGRTVLDLGAGTGKLTRPLAATGARVIALEPLEGMRRTLAAVLPEVEMVDGTAETIPLPDASVDGATAAQAFHWFDTDRAYPELHRVVRPGGTVAVVFNRRLVDTPAQAVMDALRSPLRRATPSWDDHTWEEALHDPPGFDSHPGPHVRHDHVLTLDLAVARVASTSFVAGLPDDERQELLDEARRSFAELAHDDTVTFTYAAEVTWLRRRER